MSDKPSPATPEPPAEPEEIAAAPDRPLPAATLELIDAHIARQQAGDLARLTDLLGRAKAVADRLGDLARLTDLLGGIGEIAGEGVAASEAENAAEVPTEFSLRVGSDPRPVPFSFESQTEALAFLRGLLRLIEAEFPGEEKPRDYDDSLLRSTARVGDSMAKVSRVAAALTEDPDHRRQLLKDARHLESNSRALRGTARRRLFRPAARRRVRPRARARRPHCSARRAASRGRTRAGPDDPDADDPPGDVEAPPAGGQIAEPVPVLIGGAA